MTKFGARKFVLAVNLLYLFFQVTPLQEAKITIPNRKISAFRNFSNDLLLNCFSQTNNPLNPTKLLIRFIAVYPHRFDKK